ncbi:hypothetical protein D3C81_1300150 [compost metagenome]
MRGSWRSRFATVSGLSPLASVTLISCSVPAIGRFTPSARPVLASTVRIWVGVTDWLPSRQRTM